MKKVRLSLKRGTKTSWSFTLYDSAESALYLRDEPPSPDGFEEEYRKVVALNPGEIIEAEWVGSEWVFVDDESNFLEKSKSLQLTNNYDKYDKVRIGKISPIKGAEEKMGYFELYSGWCFGGDVPWSKKNSQPGLKITVIKGKIISKFDFQKLFSDPTIGLLQQDEEAQPLSSILN